MSEETSEALNALLHIADDHPCCKSSLIWAHKRFLELERENAALREELKIMEHRVIVCGVAATHPDPNLTLGYPKEWDSQQAEQVRSLRAENAALRQDKARLDWLDYNSISRLDRVMVHIEHNKISVREAIDAARKEDLP